MKIQFQVRTHTTRAPISADGGKHSTSRARRPFAPLLSVALVLATVGLSSCVGVTSAGSGGGNPGTGAGILSASASSLSFGNVSVGNTKTQSVTITNTGTVAVNVSQATITGAGYTVIGGSPSTSIAVGQTSTLQIQLAPLTSGVNNGSLSVVSDASNSPLTIALTGTGTASVLTMSPETLQFGNVKVGQSATQSVKLTNSGNVDLVVNLAQISGTGFGMTGLSLPATISAGKSISFNVQFTPPSAQGMTGSIKFTDNASNSPQGLTLAGAGTAANATLTANPGSFAFGNVALGSNATQTITLTNSGTTSIAISQAAASGTGFSITGLNPMTLNASQTTTFTAKFAPAAAGSATGAITITSNATNSTLTIGLSGTGTQGHLTANPASVSFGSLVVGSNASVSVTLTNSGTGNVSITEGTASGTGFTMSDLAATTLTAGQSTSFTVKYAPTTAGASTGNVSITSNAPGSPLAIPLSGTGTQTQPQLTLNPTAVPFGNVSVGSSSSQNVTITNSGNGTLNITGATPSGAGFSFTGLGVQSINAGASITFAAKFSPTATGSVTGSISITSNAASSPANLALTGTGIQSQLAANPSSASFGTVIMGNSNSQTISLTNGGTAAVSVSQANITGTGFSISGMPTLPMTINPGSSKTFNAVFTPTTSGSVTGSVSLVSTAPNSPLSITLSGTGQTATHLLSANPTSLNFNSVNDGSSSSLNVTLTNTGNSSITISTATASGTGFSASGAAGTTLTPNQAATLSVTFAPTVAGAVTGSVPVISNATNSPTISLSGTGVQLSTHSVDLSWTSSTSSGVVGYNIYRGTISGGPYSILDSAPVAANAYTDSAVQSGQAYFYVVRAIDGTGTESSNSTEVQANIP
ncbi:MAG: choice-of-anchor D domain-containing protein [Candidatus Acidiferrales bacterium]